MSESQERLQSEMPTTYDPTVAERKWYDTWIREGFFQAGRRPDAPKYSIVIPPPNVTGMLHIGHALDFTLQDILVRFKRMQGFDALWLPGTDHAGIATQTKVEQKLREEGKTRFDLGREAFLEKVWEWKEHYAGTIHSQWAKMGLSLDYSRERFTLDEGLSQAVREVFVRLYDKGLIYRGKRIINWDPAARTALSDIEVEYKEVNGHLYHLQYPLVDGSGHLTVATTRPETMLGDTAVAVHPDDPRYKHMIGKMLRLPIVNREIPIIADEYVDKEFGSGAVKITPAHDPNDFEVGTRHDLPQITVMDEGGQMNANAGPYQGMDRSDCRKAIVKELQDSGVCVKIEDHVHQVGHSERSGAVVEPYLSTQWFVAMKPLAERAIESQKAGQGVNFVPDRFEKVYLQWIENVRDWCISRQLWWGHRIPAWYCQTCGETHVSHDDLAVCPACGGSSLKQDEDVLDTWFSSALWPFSTLGWPNETEDLKKYYPVDVLVTGYDIVYFWVARMIFTALEFTGRVPFRDVLMHGLVRDAEGRKMSKSLGNGVDPLEVIAEYGADAMRYMISTGSTPGQDLRFRLEKVEQARNFANKIWNASRFALMNLEGFRHEDIDLSGALSTADRWILHRFHETAREITRLMESYDFGETGRLLYNFIWDDLCDWYIEFAKLSLYGTDDHAKRSTQSVLSYILDRTLRLLHPFMPYLTEEIWQHLPHEPGETITLAAWPAYDAAFEAGDAVKEMELLMDAIRAVRNIRAEMNVSPGKKIELLVKPTGTAEEAILRHNEEYVRRFCNTSALTLDAQLSPPDKAMTAILTGAELYLPLAGLIDIGQEIARLEKELSNLQAEVERVEKKLANEGYIAKAPAHVVEQERAKGEDYRDKRDKMMSRIAELRG
ncbi:MAG: valine--tRNA ligase [Cohnella sp.]|nr:valine--tRNA ligase [Cohnella sp.]